MTERQAESIIKSHPYFATVMRVLRPVSSPAMLTLYRRVPSLALRDASKLRDIQYAVRRFKQAGVPIGETDGVYFIDYNKCTPEIPSIFDDIVERMVLIANQLETESMR